MAKRWDRDTVDIYNFSYDNFKTKVSMKDCKRRYVSTDSGEMDVRNGMMMWCYVICEYIM